MIIKATVKWEVDVTMDIPENVSKDMGQHLLVDKAWKELLSTPPRIVGCLPRKELCTHDN